MHLFFMGFISSFQSLKLTILYYPMKMSKPFVHVNNHAVCIEIIMIQIYLTILINDNAVHLLFQLKIKIKIHRLNYNFPRCLFYLKKCFKQCLKSVENIEQ